MKISLLTLLCVLSLSLLAGCDNAQEQEMPAPEQEETQSNLIEGEMSEDTQTAAQEEGVSDMPAIAQVQDMPANIRISKAYTFFTAENAQSGAVFMELENMAEEDDRLVSASSPVAQIVELHETYMDEDDGTMMMRKLRDGITLPAGTIVTLKPQGFHVMLIDLQDGGIPAGSSIEVTLEFENSPAQTLDVAAYPPGLNPFADMFDLPVPDESSVNNTAAPAIDPASAPAPEIQMPEAEISPPDMTDIIEESTQVIDEAPVEDLQPAPVQ